HLNHWSSMAHADAANALDGDLCSRLGNGLLQGVKKTITSLGHATGAQADMNPGQTVRSWQRMFGGSCLRRCAILLQELGNNVGHTPTGRVAGGVVPDADHRGQSAAA